MQSASAISHRGPERLPDGTTDVAGTTVSGIRSDPAGWDSRHQQDHVIGGTRVGDLGGQLLEQGGEGAIGGGSGQNGGGTVDRIVDVTATAFNQPVGVEQQRRSGGQETLLAGARAAGQAGPQQRIMCGEALGPAAGALQQQRRRMPGVGPGQVPCAAARWAQVGVHQGPGGIQAQRSAGVLYRRHGRSRPAIGVVKVGLAKP